MKKTIIVSGTVLAVLVIIKLCLSVPGIRQEIIERGVATAMVSIAEIEADTLSVFMCGTSSPLPAPGVAQVCVAILTPDHFYLIDSGAASTANLNLSRLPMNRLQGVLLTHFHSDHIAELAEVNLVSWVQGRDAPLKIIGPTGVGQIVDGNNMTYALDHQYRIAHHGAELLSPENGELEALVINAGETFEDGDLRIEAITTDHAPISPSLAYKVTYKGRSVLVGGDSLLNEELKLASNGVDLFLSDALSRPIVQAMERGANVAGNYRLEKIFLDIQDYHASVEQVVEWHQQADIGLTALYHLVPAPSNFVMQLMYEAELGPGVMLTEDQQWFRLKAGAKSIDVISP